MVDRADPEQQNTEKAVPRQHVPLTEVGFYILMGLRQERHGYEVMQWIKAMTDGECRLQTGTLYNCLFRLEREGLIVMTRAEERRKYYRLTDLGKEALRMECLRLERVYQNSKGLPWKKTACVQTFDGAR